MCGRFAVVVSEPEILQQAFNLPAVPEEIAPRYNITPSQQVITVIRAKEGNQLAWMRWGLIPTWAKESSVGNKLINARAETAAEKPSFRSAFKKRRCLVVATGYYEWRRNGTKVPFYITLKDGQPFGMAGLWEWWKDPKSGESLTTCAILTTTPNALMETIHNRMPVILPPETYAEWLEPEIEDSAALQRLLVSYPAEAMTAYPVSARVNNPRHDDPSLIDRAPTLF